MATIVLVHGSWHDGTAWDATKRHLESAGHKVFAPTVAGYGKSANRNVNHAQCVKSIVDFILQQSLTDFVLVGHSFGGTFISKVAEAIPERIPQKLQMPSGKSAGRSARMASCAIPIRISKPKRWVQTSSGNRQISFHH